MASVLTRDCFVVKLLVAVSCTCSLVDSAPIWGGVPAGTSPTKKIVLQGSKIKLFNIQNNDGVDIYARFLPELDVNNKTDVLPVLTSRIGLIFETPDRDQDHDKAGQKPNSILVEDSGEIFDQIPKDEETPVRRIESRNPFQHLGTIKFSKGFYNYYTNIYR